MSFDLLVKYAATAQRRQAIDLEDPGLQRLVKHNVKSENLEATPLPISYSVHLRNYRILNGNESLDDDIFAVFEEIRKRHLVLRVFL